MVLMDIKMTRNILVEKDMLNNTTFYIKADSEDDALQEFLDQPIIDSRNLIVTK